MSSFNFSLLVFVVLFFWPSLSFAAQKKIEIIHSSQLSRKMDILLITPKGKISQAIWLLHGYRGSAKKWKSISKLKQWSDNYNIAFICPSALPEGWYLDSPKKKHSKVKTYLTVELPQWLKEKNLLLPGNRQWAIGTSMGGHGVLTLSLARPDLWTGVSSIAGITELEAFPEKWQIKSHLGRYSASPQLWSQHSFNSLLRSGAKPLVFIILDCGRSDFAFASNQITHNILSEKNIPHHFWSEPGSHNFKYVIKVMQRHVEFSVKYIKNHLK